MKITLRSLLKKLGKRSLLKEKKKLEGVINFRAWNKMIDIHIAKGLLGNAKGKFIELEKDEEKEKFEKDDNTTMIMIVDSIKDHLIPYVSGLQLSKKMYNYLTGLFTINTIGQVMSLKNGLCDVRMTRNVTITSYFMRI